MNSNGRKKQCRLPGVPDNIRELWRRADVLWEAEQSRDEYYSYASADYELVYQSLVSLQGKATTILELGSGLGVVTIMASLLGFDSFGIEAEEILVLQSRDFARQLDCNAVFACGSFIPDAFEWNPYSGDESVRTVIDIPDAYDELDMRLQDFDLIYAYPWPTEHTLYHNILRQFARPGAHFLSYDAREGIGMVSI